VSEQDMKVVRALWDAWERRDTPAMFELYQEDIVWDMTRSQVPGMGLYQGKEGVRQFFQEWLGTFGDFYARAEEFVDAGDHIVVRMRQGGRGTESGVDVEMPMVWQSYWVRDGRIERIVVHRDYEEAMARRS
jgi:ketosteroid isomerase-like protein